MFRLTGQVTRAGALFRKTLAPVDLSMVPEPGTPVHAAHRSLARGRMVRGSSSARASSSGSITRLGVGFLRLDAIKVATQSAEAFLTVNVFAIGE